LLGQINGIRPWTTSKEKRHVVVGFVGPGMICLRLQNNKS
jgi:hypothetical protein